MTYPQLFQNYYPLKGKDWLRFIPSEDRRVFVSIGLQEAQHGRLGGIALHKKRGSEWFKHIGRLGGIATAKNRGRNESIY